MFRLTITGGMHLIVQLSQVVDCQNYWDICLHNLGFMP